MAKLRSQVKAAGIAAPATLQCDRYAADDPGTSIVATMDPVAALKLTRNELVAPIAEDVKARLERVLTAVEVSLARP